MTESGRSRSHTLGRAQLMRRLDTAGRQSRSPGSCAAGAQPGQSHSRIRAAARTQAQPGLRHNRDPGVAGYQAQSGPRHGSHLGRRQSY